MSYKFTSNAAKYSIQFSLCKKLFYDVFGNIVSKKVQNIYPPKASLLKYGKLF